MSETKTQCFALYGGVFIPIVDNVVRDGVYIVDDDAMSDDVFYSLCRVLRRVVTDDWELPTGGGHRLSLPAKECGRLVRIVWSSETSLQIGVKFDT